MGKKGFIILAVAVAVLYMVFKEDRQPSSPQVKAVGQMVQKDLLKQSLSTQTDGSLKKIGSWPFSGGQQDVALLDSNLNRKNFVLIFDGSGSMAEKKCSGSQTKAEVAKNAVNEWSASVPEDANLGLVAFDQSALSVRLPLGMHNRDQFQDEILAVAPNYQTPLAASIEMAYQMLTEQGRRQLGYGEYIVVVVTDGIANDPAALGHVVSRILSDSPVMINTIGFCIAANHSLNQKGRTFYRAANDPAALRQGLQDVLAESESFDISGFQ